MMISENLFTYFMLGLAVLCINLMTFMFSVAFHLDGFEEQSVLVINIGIIVSIIMVVITVLILNYDRFKGDVK